MTTFNNIEAKALSIGYKTKKEIAVIASNIDIALKPGQICAIVGSNGIGKSTLLKTLGKIQPQLSGAITLKGKPLSFYGQAVLARHISIVLTEPIPAKNLTVTELISLGRQPYTNWIGSLSENDGTKIKDAIAMLALDEIKHKKCFELSDGQLQRVMIARALAQDTEIILLDEPTTHLDLHHKVQILKLLQQIALATQKTVLFTSHEIELAIQVCDTLLVMTESKTAFGTTEDLIEQGAFDSMFPQHMITFNAETRTFNINT